MRPPKKWNEALFRLSEETRLLADAIKQNADAPVKTRVIFDVPRGSGITGLEIGDLVGVVAECVDLRLELDRAKRIPVATTKPEPTFKEGEEILVRAPRDGIHLATYERPHETYGQEPYGVHGTLHYVRLKAQDERLCLGTANIQKVSI